ncbi:MAG: hypothetical protein M1837_007006 [Sclerophora amabilis]|nr:MAG: hypothetical protein M1837_007006 [Sclerophora amabilis]
MTETEARTADLGSGLPATSTEPVGISPSDDPFAAQRGADDNPFTERSDSVGELGSSPPIGSPKQRDRRMSKEWDASKVPPSRFQKREGSIYATPGSRDGHVAKNNQQGYKDKLKEKGWFGTGNSNSAANTNTNANTDSNK